MCDLRLLEQTTPILRLATKAARPRSGAVPAKMGRCAGMSVEGSSPCIRGERSQCMGGRERRIHAKAVETLHTRPTARQGSAPRGSSEKVYPFRRGAKRARMHKFQRGLAVRFLPGPRGTTLGLRTGDPAMRVE